MPQALREVENQSDQKQVLGVEEGARWRKGTLVRSGHAGRRAWLRKTEAPCRSDNNSNLAQSQWGTALSGSTSSSPVRQVLGN